MSIPSDAVITGSAKTTVTLGAPFPFTCEQIEEVVWRKADAYQLTHGGTREAAFAKMWAATDDDSIALRLCYDRVFAARARHPQPVAKADEPEDDFPPFIREPVEELMRRDRTLTRAGAVAEVLKRAPALIKRWERYDSHKRETRGRAS